MLPLLLFVRVDILLTREKHLYKYTIPLKNTSSLTLPHFLEMHVPRLERVWLWV